MPLRENISWLLQMEGDLSAQADQSAKAIKGMGLSADQARKEIAALKAEQKGLAKDSPEYEALAGKIKHVGAQAEQTKDKVAAYKEQQQQASEASKVWSSNLLGVAAVIGATVAVVGLATRAVEAWISSTQEANKHLRQLGQDTGDAGRSIDRYAVAVTGLGETWDRLEVRLSGGPMERLAQVANVASRLVDLFDQASSKVDGFASSLTGAVDSPAFRAFVMTLGSSVAPAIFLPKLDAWMSSPAAYARTGGESRADEYGPFQDASALAQARTTGDYGPSYDTLLAGKQTQIDASATLATSLRAEQFAASATMRQYAIQAPNQLGGSMGFLGANTQNPWQTGSLGAGMSYHPMLQQPGLMGQQLPTLASPMLELAAATRANTAATDNETAAADAATKAHQAANFQQGASGLSAGLSGGGVSGIVGAAAGGPVGMIASAVIGALPHLRSILKDLFDEALTIFTDLPDIIGSLASTLVPALIKAAPEMAAAYVFLGPDIVAEMVKSAPEIFASVVDAILGIPKAFADNLKKFAADVVDAANPFNDGFHPFKNFHPFGDGSDHATGAKGGSRGGTGGGGGASGGRRGSPGKLEVHLHGGSVQDQTRALRKVLGPYGSNLSIDPYVTA